MAVQTQVQNEQDEEAVAAVVQGYLACMLWSSSGDDDQPLDAGHTVHDVAPEAVVAAEADCRKFLAEQQYSVQAFMQVTGRPYDHVGHDLWLTRAGHGTGFWDRGAGKVGDTLTRAAKRLGAVDPYVGDDGLVHT